MKLSQVSIHAFIQENQIKTETGAPLDFYKYRFLFDVYADRSYLLCCMKAAQIGFSTYEILTTAFECKNYGIDIIYVLPSDDDVNRFSGGKTNKIIMQNPVLQTWTKDKDSTYQKQFGANTIYYEGAWTERAALSTTAKKLVVDEFDRCKPDVVEQYDSRLQSEANPRKAFFSNPSMPNTGIHSYYLLSDQKKWHVKHSCGEEFVFDESCINYQEEIYECPSCQGAITDKERVYGEWKATAEGKWSGYWIPLWLAPWMGAANIAEFKRTKTAEYFANFVAGLPYIGGADTIAPATVLRNCIPDTNTQEGQIIIGVDTGLPWYLVCVNKDGPFYYEKLKDIGAPGTPKDYDPKNRVRELLKRWSKSIVVADQGGDLTPMRILQQEFPGRIFLAYYRRDRKTQEVIQWGTGNSYGEVDIDRNKMIQLIVEQLRDIGRIRFHGSTADWEELAAHFGNIYREQVVVKESKDKDIRTLYGNEYVWKRNGPDHYVHALLYALVGLDKYGGDAAKIVGEDDFGELPTGRFFSNPSPDELQRRMDTHAKVVDGFSADDFKNNQMEL